MTDKRKKSPDIWMPLYMGDFKASTSELSHEEKFAYIELIWAYWKARHRGLWIKNDKKTLKNIAGISSKKLDKILGFFQVKNDNLFHPRIEELVTEAIEKHEKSVERTTPARLAKAAKTASVTGVVTDHVTGIVTSSITGSIADPTITITNNKEDKEDLINGSKKNVDKFSASPGQQPASAHKDPVDNSKKPAPEPIDRDKWTIATFLTDLDKRIALSEAPQWDIDVLIKYFDRLVKSPGRQIPTYDPPEAFYRWVVNFTKGKPPS